MSARNDKPAVTAWIWAAALGACLTGSSCTQLKLPGNNFRDDLARWGETQRPAGSQGDLWGFSNEARQVERNLGVR